MTTEQNIYAEVRNTFKSYDESGLIDEISMKTWLRSEYKRFGNNVMVDTDDIVEVTSGKAHLPNDFWTLREAWKYKPSYYCVNEGDEQELEKSGFWRTRVIQNGVECDCKGRETNTTFIKEEYHFKNNSADIYYGYPSPLRLKKGFNRKAVAKDCVNLPSKVQRKNKNEINILGDYIQTEFERGYIYIKYSAIPMDDDGNIIIPETQHDRLKTYLEYHIKAHIAEELWLNNDDPNMSNKLQYLKQQESHFFALAMTEAKAIVMNPSTWKTLKNMNRRRYAKYESVVPSLNFRR